MKVGKIPQRRAQEPTAVFLPGESYGQRPKESDMTESTQHIAHIIKVKLLFQKLCSLKKIVIYQFFLHLVACIHITVLSPCVYHQDKLCKKRPISYFNLSFIITEAKHLFPYLFPISNFYFVNDTFLSFLFITVVFISFLMHFFLLLLV